MAKDKQKKQKERQKRNAQKKLAEQRAARERSASDAQKKSKVASLLGGQFAPETDSAGNPKDRFSKSRDDQ